MTKKQLSILILVSTIALSPVFAGAETKEKSSNKSIVQERADRQDKKELEEETRETKNNATSTKVSTSTPNKESVEEAKARTVQAAINIFQKTTREINKLKNIISRLSNQDSIVKKLDAKGVNTAAIKAKFDSAQTFISKAEADLQSVQKLISATATSSVVTKEKVLGVRKLFTQIKADLKSALIKIKEANKLIREIPGVREIGKTSTSSPAATTSSQTN